MRNGNLLKSHVSEICVQWISINQGVGVFISVFWNDWVPNNSHAHFFSRPNLKTTVLYSQASGLCLIVRNTGSRWLDIFTCKNPRPTHHIYWPVLSLFIMYKLESYENAQTYKTTNQIKLNENESVWSERIYLGHILLRKSDI